MRKFLHKRTKNMVKEFPEGFFLVDARGNSLEKKIPTWIVEYSSDWEEILDISTPYASEEGVPIRKEEVIYMVWPSSSYIAAVKGKEIGLQPPGYKLFSYLINAERYVKENEKKFSEKDILNAMEKSRTEQRFPSFERLKQKLGIS